MKGKERIYVKIFNRVSKNAQTTVKFEFNLQEIITFFNLEQCEAEKQVLCNINKFDRMQFMGLRDKNDTLIYFGDILIDENNNLLTPCV